MEKYNKPIIEVVKIAPEVTIAAESGLSSWLEGNEISAATNLTTFEYISE